MCNVPPKKVRERIFSFIGYHTLTKEAFGQEKRSTFFMYHKSTKPYHIDYCHCKKEIMKSCQILSPIDWLSISDHVPIIIELEI